MDITKEQLIFSAQILLVFGLLMFAVNEGYTYWQHTGAIRDPCGACIKLNPDLHLVKEISNYGTINITNFSFQPRN